MTRKYRVSAVTMNDDEADELRELGIPITTKGDVQDSTTFDVDLTDEQAEAVWAHSAVFAMSEL